MLLGMKVTLQFTETIYISQTGKKIISMRETNPFVGVVTGFEDLHDCETGVVTDEVTLSAY